MRKTTAGKNIKKGATLIDARMPIMPWWWAVAATVASIVLGVTAWFIVWSIARHDATLKVEAIKVGLSVAGGVGAVSGLLLAFRKQIHSEYVARDDAFDAEQRRVTELFAKAIEQLGHDKSAVRLGSLYSLERLGQGNADQRQTVVDVICAYLRMPYALVTMDETASNMRQVQNPADPQAPSIRDEIWSREELLVRKAAQEILGRRLLDPELYGANECWSDMSVNLQDALLVDIHFIGCTIHEANFRKATFVGETWFEETTFTSTCDFSGATFEAEANFGTCFKGSAEFESTRFNGPTIFSGSFANDAIFDEAKFNGNVDFRTAAFTGLAFFKKTSFGGAAKFTGTQFNYTSFKGSSFSSSPDFTGAVTVDREAIGGTVSDLPDSWELLPSQKKGELLIVRAQKLRPKEFDVLLYRSGPIRQGDL